MALWTPQDEPGLLGWWDMSNPLSYDNGTKIWTKKYGTIDNWVAPADGPTKITFGMDADYDSLLFSTFSDTSLEIANPGFNEVVVAAMLRIDSAQNVTVLDHYISEERFLVFSFGGGRVEYLDQSTDYYDGGAWPQNFLIVFRQSTAQRIQRWNGAEVVDETTGATGTPISTALAFRLFTPQEGITFTAECTAIGLFDNDAWSDALAE